MADDDAPVERWLLDRGGPWACWRGFAEPAVEQAGERRLWDELEGVHAAWVELGRPGKAQLMVAVGPDGGTTVAAPGG